MKVASKLIVLVRDAEGFGASIAGSLQPSPGSNLTRSEATPFELSLENYGIKDRKAEGDLVQFFDPHGSPKVSMMLLPNYEPPVAACAIREILATIVSDKSSEPPTLMVPYVVNTMKHIHEVKNGTPSEEEGTVYCTEVGGSTDFTQAMLAGTARPPPSLQIHCEALACLLHMLRVLKLPAVLIAANGRNQTRRSSEYEIEALFSVGQFVANHCGLYISRDEIQWKPRIQSRQTAEEPWRALYG
ncbi:hypothetical protein J5N97_008076 [Dioscorea zingiberensis]|uniref:DUF7894 domain-containing protein n=1 Tax=Dioscorea zingiberensis TaxID=325984 RepID=A0A9D5DDH9_9LILI|nr:hypothetical protein J5N97_008076 [Dioscorea zingiberensis]